MNLTIDDLKTRHEGTYICPLCLGEGIVVDLEPGNGEETLDVDCPYCKGIGEIDLDSNTIPEDFVNKIRDEFKRYSTV